MNPTSEDYEVASSISLFINKLNDETINGALVVVEGQRDVEALKTLGFKGPLLTLSHNSSLVALASEAEKYRKTILLLDLDRKGRILTKKAATILQEKRNKIDLFYRRELASLTKGRVREVEGLIRYSELLPKY